MSEGSESAEMGYWEARYEVEREKRRLECSTCDQRLMFDADRAPNAPTLRQTTIPFRCRCCGRVFCRECSVDHFGLEGDVDV